MITQVALKTIILLKLGCKPIQGLTRIFPKIDIVFKLNAPNQFFQANLCDSTDVLITGVDKADTWARIEVTFIPYWQSTVMQNYIKYLFL